MTDTGQPDQRGRELCSGLTVGFSAMSRELNDETEQNSLNQVL
jgi:hypothetical protein